MNDDDLAKTDEVAVYLKEQFPDSAMERERKMGRGLSCYYIKVKAGERMILKITDECIMDKNVDEIKNVIMRRCIPSMESNKNHDVVLFNDFHIEIDVRQ